MLLLWLILWMLVLSLLLSLVWCWYTFSFFCHVCSVSYLALNCSSPILFYCAIYFLTFSIFILPCLLFFSFVYLFLLYFFYLVPDAINLGISPILIFLNFNSSLTPQFDDPLIIYSFHLIFDILDDGPVMNNYEVNFGFLSS